MNCKECRYYTGVKCFGHGEFWGECKLINFCIEELELHCDCVSAGTETFCYDDTECKISKMFNLTEYFFIPINKEKK